jgi:hypothetical protein
VLITIVVLAVGSKVFKINTTGGNDA